MNACQKGKSLSAQSQSSNSFDENLIQKWVNNSCPQHSLIESDSVISESSIISSQWSGNTSISEFLVNNHPSRKHIKKGQNTSLRQPNKIEKRVKYPPPNNSVNPNVLK